MFADRRMHEDEVCPVPDELLGELYRADENRVSELAATVAPCLKQSSRGPRRDLDYFSHVARFNCAM
jgi:hypothetical protein